MAVDDPFRLKSVCDVRKGQKSSWNSGKSCCITRKFEFNMQPDRDYPSRSNNRSVTETRFTSHLL